MILAEILETERLFLRSLSPGDATDTYLAWLVDEQVTRYLEVRFAPPKNLADLADFIRACNESVVTLLLGLFLKTTGAHIGNIKLGPIDRHHRRADIGLMIGSRDAWGKAYGREAIAALTRYGFDQLGLTKIMAGCYAANEGSRRAFLAAGFIEEGRLARHWILDDGLTDHVMMAAFKRP